MRSPKSASTSTKPQQIRAVGYVRVSTEIQVSEGVSLETQRVKIRAHCIAHDIDLIEIISDDGVSAKSLDDQGLKRALWMLDAGQGGSGCRRQTRQADALCEGLGSPL
jgi:DNA invertase Pin-like site-specific DNA recombinase